MSSTSTTQKDPGSQGTYWRHLNSENPAFNPIVFNEMQLAEQGFISGEAGAGRGNTYFITLDNNPLVLRHYRRGGMISKVSSSRYFFTGLSRTRAMREFDICLKMHDMQLPVPKPYACRVVHRGATYEASIVTHRLPGNTLAEQLVSNKLTDENWAEIGRTIARFHKSAIYHADLNAHNILLDDTGTVSLIDFDRACFHRMSKTHTAENWCVSNIERLERSITKEVNKVTVSDLKKHTVESQYAVFSLEALAKKIMHGVGLIKASWFSA